MKFFICVHTQFDTEQADFLRLIYQAAVNKGKRRGQKINVRFFSLFEFPLTLALVHARIDKSLSDGN